MKVLFVCRSNAGRSQIACALFQKITKNHEAASAGIEVSKDGKEGYPPGRLVILAMAEDDIDISKSTRKQLTSEMVDKAGKVIVLMTKDEQAKYLPEYLRNN